MESKQKQKDRMKRNSKNIKELIQVINNKFNQYLDEKEEEKQRNPIERVIDEFKVEIEEWKE